MPGFASSAAGRTKSSTRGSSAGQTSSSAYETAEEDPSSQDKSLRRKDKKLSTKGKGKINSKGKGKGKGGEKGPEDFASAPSLGLARKTAKTKTGLFGALSTFGRAFNSSDAEAKAAKSVSVPAVTVAEEAPEESESDQEEEEEEEPSTESSASADSREEELTIEERKPAGDSIEICRLPDTMKEKYVFLELLYDSCQGHRVYLCEDMRWKPKIELSTEHWAAPRQKPRRAVRGQLGVELLDREVREQEDIEEYKEIEKAPKRRRCVMKVWQKSARAPKDNKAWLDVQLTLLSMERHPNLVLPRRIWEDELAYYVDFDAIMTGCSLLQMILTDASFTERQVKRVTRGILRGLNHLHRNHLVHRDIKPDNILLEWQDDALGLLAKTAKLPKGYHSTKNGVKQWRPAATFKSSWTRHELVVGVRIIDFDLVAPFTGPGGRVPIEPGEEPEMANVSCPRICGTPGYMAPEAFCKFPGPQGDLFGVGVIIFLMVACDAPCHDAVLRILDAGRIEDVDETKLQRLCKAVISSIEEIDWECHPWDQLPMARDLCRQLIHPKPRSRGVDAGDIMKSSPWFLRQAAVQLAQFTELQAIQSRLFAGQHDQEKKDEEADDEMEGDLNIPVVVGRSMRRAGLVEVKQEEIVKDKKRGKEKEETKVARSQAFALAAAFGKSFVSGTAAQKSPGSSPATSARVLGNADKKSPRPSPRAPSPRTRN